MSYRCKKCTVVCNHAQIRVVTERDANRNIVQEKALCRDCAADMRINVPAPAEYKAPDVETARVLIGSA